jgi:hypothetical protein
MMDPCPRSSPPGAKNAIAANLIGVSGQEACIDGRPRTPIRVPGRLRQRDNDSDEVCGYTWSYALGGSSRHTDQLESAGLADFASDGRQNGDFRL